MCCHGGHCNQLLAIEQKCNFDKSVIYSPQWMMYVKQVLQVFKYNLFSYHTDMKGRPVIAWKVEKHSHQSKPGSLSWKIINIGCAFRIQSILTDLRTEGLFTGLKEYYCMCVKVVAPEEAAQSLINVLKWCHLNQRWLGLKTTSD